MRKNKLKVTPYLSALASPSTGYDVSYGATAKKGPLSVSVSSSKGTGYSSETNVDLNLSIPITKKVKGKLKL